MELARQISSWSKDPSKKIGAVVIGENGQVLAQGYNGFPRGVKDTEERYNNRETKYNYIVHAEMNAIYNASWNGVSLKDATIYIYGLPCCHECAKGIIQSIPEAISQGKPPEPIGREIQKQKQLDCAMGHHMIQTNQ